MGQYDTYGEGSSQIVYDNLGIGAAMHCLLSPKIVLRCPRLMRFSVDRMKNRGGFQKRAVPVEAKE